MTRAICLIFGAALIFGAGIWHGSITGRWGESHELQLAVDRLATLPKNIGDWVSKDLEIKASHLQAAEIAGYISRVYQNKKTGEYLSILLVCGKPGPISVHSPDVCYQGAGYQMGPKSPFSFRNAATDRSADFWVAKFTKDPDPAPLHILWSWTTGKVWMAPDNPRLAFFQAPVLYKLYIVREAKGLDAPLVDEITHGFIKEVLPVIKNTLSGQSSSTSN
jgi:hypothetical protein